MLFLTRGHAHHSLPALDPWQSLTYVKKNGLEKEVVVLVLELAVGGELFDFMMYTGAFPEVIARTYFGQVLYGVSAAINFQPYLG